MITSEWAQDPWLSGKGQHQYWHNVKIFAPILTWKPYWFGWYHVKGVGVSGGHCEHLFFRRWEMFRRASLSLSQVQSSVAKQLRRNYGVTALLAQQLDPIQQLFLTKTREYAQKSKYVSERVTSVTTVTDWIKKDSEYQVSNFSLP